MPDRLLLIFIAVSSLATGCKEPHDEVSLPPDAVLINIIHDLHLGEASMSRVHILSQDSVSLEIRQRIANTYNTTPEQMDLWLEALQKSPEHLLAVYDSVIARFEKEVPPR